MFPKNWNEQRVKEEIALVYDKMIKAGKEYHPKNKNRDFIEWNSDQTFRILIEFDELGRLTNGYPKI